MNANDAIASARRVASAGDEVPQGALLNLRGACSVQRINLRYLRSFAAAFGVVALCGHLRFLSS
jgi:hypothetical protein